MNEIEAIGDLTTHGGLAAPALEPSASVAVGTDGHTQESTCLNCGTPLVGSHCHACGQRGHQHRTMGAFLHDLVHGVFHLEGKVWHTLPMLAVKPGELTRRYIDGERARFVSPMALFLFSIFLMFAVFQVMGVAPPSDLGPSRVDPSGASPGSVLQSRLNGLEDAREGMDDGNPSAAILDTQIAELQHEIARTQDAGDPVVVVANGRGDSSVDQSGTGIEFLDHGIDKWRENPSLMAYKLQNNAYKFSWALIPLSVPFVWLLFAWRRRFGLYDHAVFVTYSLSFMTLLLVAVALVGAAGLSGAALSLVLVLIPTAHIYKQLRGAYQLSRLSAAWRLVAVLLFIVVIVLIYLNALLLLGAL
jgi:hypothetical protein